MVLNKGFWWSLSLLGPLLGWAHAQGTEYQAPTVEVRGSGDLATRAWSPSVENEVGRLKRGKNIQVQDLQASPVVPLQNYRHQFSRTPGLMVSEVNNESFPSLSLRGLGDPHESQNLLLMEDGVPLAADLYGYSAQYYQPPFEWMEATELYRGGASLLFGPLPAGALDYKMKRARVNGPLSAGIQWRMGSFDFKSIQGEIAKSLGKKDAFLFQAQNKSSDGFRQANSGFDMTRVRGQWVREFSPGERLRLTINHSDSLHGEPGGLALSSGAGRLSITDSREAVTLLQDAIALHRTQAVLGYEREQLEVKLYGGYFKRESFRQNLGSGVLFGGVPTEDSNTIQRQMFKTAAIETRTHWEDGLLGLQNRNSAGVLLYAVDSPFDQETGATAGARQGTLTRSLSRQTRTVSLFLERRFESEIESGRNWSLTPGVRIENIYQSIRENLNTSSATLRSTSTWDHVVLMGWGGEWEWSDSLYSFANYSQSYKPAGFQESLPLAPGVTAIGDLNPARAWTAELGVASREGTTWDWKLSAFLIRYSDQFGRIGNVLQNTGAAEHQGIEASWAVPLIRRPVAVSWVANLMGLHARFTEGPFEGKTPQYAPKWLAKNSILMEISNRAKLSLTQQFVSQHFADDGNTSQQRISDYQVFDLSLESRILDGPFYVYASVLNLFDREYTSRIRANGIEPAPPRTLIFGASAQL